MPIVKSFSKGSIRGHGRNRLVWTALGPSISSTGLDSSGVTGSYTFDPQSTTKQVINITGSRFTNVNRVTFSRGGTIYFDQSVVSKVSFDTGLDNTGQLLSDTLIKIQIPLYNAGGNGLPSSWNGSSMVDVTLTLYDSVYSSTGTAAVRIYFKPEWQTASGLLATIPVGGTTPYMLDDTLSTSVEAQDGNSQAVAITYSRVSGSFPSGITLNSSTGAITGNPSNIIGTAEVNGSTTYNFTIRATSSADSSLYADRSFSLLQQADFPPIFVKATNGGDDPPGADPFVFDDKTEGQGWSAGQNIEDIIYSSGKDSYDHPQYPSDAYKFELVSGSVPTGLTFEGSTDFNDNVEGWSATGTIGQVSSDTTYNWTVRATTPSGRTRNQNYQITILDVPTQSATVGITPKYYPTIAGTGTTWRLTFCSPRNPNVGTFGDPCHTNISGGVLTVTQNISIEPNTTTGGVNAWEFNWGDYSNWCVGGGTPGGGGAQWGNITITRVSRTGSFTGTISESGTDFPTSNGQSVTFSNNAGDYGFLYWNADLTATAVGSYTLTWTYNVTSVNVSQIVSVINVTCQASVS
jgi:hypothetical protein